MVRIAIVKPSGEVEASLTTQSYKGTNPTQFLKDISHKIALLSEKHTGSVPKYLGIGAAGIVDQRSGTIIYAPNLGWKDVHLGKIFSIELGIPVTVVNDLTAITVGEWRYGAARGYDDFVCIFVGTGIGGGIVCDGKLVSGSGGSAGEIGHIITHSGGRLCSCGNRGCLEAYAGGWAIAERAKELVRKNPSQGELIASRAGSIDKITAAHVAEAAGLGDKLAEQILDVSIAYLGDGIISVLNILNPAIVVLGGGVMMGLPNAIDRIQKAVDSKSLTNMSKKAKVVMNELGDMAGVIGAAHLGREQADQVPVSDE